MGGHPELLHLNVLKMVSIAGSSQTESLSRGGRCEIINEAVAGQAQREVRAIST